jgi:flavodoxin
MNALIVYDSKFGNTERIARSIGEELGSAHVVSIAEAARLDLAAYDLLVVGGPTHIHGMSQPMRGLASGFIRGTLRDVPAAAFDTRYHAPAAFTGSAAHGIAHSLKRAGALLIVEPESFFVRSDEAQTDTSLEEGEVERARSWAGVLRERTAALRRPMAAR